MMSNKVEAFGVPECSKCSNSLVFSRDILWAMKLKLAFREPECSKCSYSLLFSRDI